MLCTLSVDNFTTFLILLIVKYVLNGIKHFYNNKNFMFYALI